MMMPFAKLLKCPRYALSALAVLSAPLVVGYSPAAASGATQISDQASYVYFTPGSRSTMMRGSTDDIRRAEKLRGANEGMLYLRSGGAAYVIRDAATLRKAEQIFAPQKALGARQGELGSRQGALGKRQGQFGAEQARIGRLQAGASARAMGELGRQQAALGRQQAELGRQQAELGKEQAVLGREQGRLAAIATRQLRTLLEEAVQRGVAQRVD
jgi:hypothetical protein